MGVSKDEGGHHRDSRPMVRDAPLRGAPHHEESFAAEAIDQFIIRAARLPPGDDLRRGAGQILDETLAGIALAGVLRGRRMQMAEYAECQAEARTIPVDRVLAQRSPVQIDDLFSDEERLLKE